MGRMREVDASRNDNREGEHSREFERQPHNDFIITPRFFGHNFLVFLFFFLRAPYSFLRTPCPFRFTSSPALQCP